MTIAGKILSLQMSKKVADKQEATGRNVTFSATVDNPMCLNGVLKPQTFTVLLSF
jgi:hypothetical protein